MAKRIEYVDIAKGFSILLVVIYHMANQDYSNEYPFFVEVNSYFSVFRMPFFFFMSGVFFSYSKSFMPFLLSKADVFLKPYFFVLTLLYVFNVIAYGDGAKLTVWGILYGNASTITWAPMWFLTHLFVLYLFSYVVFVF